MRDTQLLMPWEMREREKLNRNSGHAVSLKDTSTITEKDLTDPGT